MPDLSIEAELGGLVAGLDEVGRGPLAGPVVAAAVVFLETPAPALSALIDDSKRLSAAKRAKADRALRDSTGVAFAIGAASVAEIETHNILAASHLAMRRALARLRVRPAAALVDGSVLPALGLPARAIVGGDRISLSIAAASILAKVARDRAMTRLSLRWPHYAWDRNSGYGTAAHLAGLAQAGASPHHRMGFAPLRRFAA